MDRKIGILIFIILSFFLLSGCSSIIGKRQLTSQRDIDQVNRWMENAHALYTVGDYEGAIVYYKRVLKYYPNTAYAKKAQDRIRMIKNLCNIRELIRRNPGLLFGP